MASELDFGPPLIVGRVEPELLDELVEIYPLGQHQVDWEVRSDRGVLGPIEPLAELILHEQPDGVGMIRFDIDTNKVPPAGTQRSQGWHIDGKVNEHFSYIVANMLPTEFLVLEGFRDKRLRRKIERHIRNQRALSGGWSTGVTLDPQPSKLHGSVVRPKPYEVVAFRNHIHRSPFNHTGKTIMRNWIRAAIFEDES